MAVYPEQSRPDSRQWFWATLALTSVTLVSLVFTLWELLENRLFRDIDYVSLHYLYISRGITSSFLLAMWAAWFVSRDRRKSEAVLRESQEHYRGLLEAAPSAVTLFDDRLTVREWNAAAERLYGCAREDVCGRGLPTLDNDSSQELHAFMQCVKSGDPVLDVETIRRAADGTPVDVQLSLLPFHEKDHLYFLEVTSDIRERVRMRAHMMELEKLSSMGKMAAGTAHHLNTPLASMLLRVQMMRERASSGSDSDLARLEQTITFCQHFVRKLLDLARRPESRLDLERVTSIVDAVLGFFGPTAASKGVNVQLCNDGAADSMVRADRNQLETLLLTLLSNALDAVARGGTIRVEITSNDAGAVEIVIQDDGCGIPEAVRAHIFEPFFTTKPVGTGTGLGLAIAHSIVKEHGGEISLESEMGRGTSVHVRLPVAKSVAAGAAD
jgi:PAS domain S-box-containing protein